MATCNNVFQLDDISMIGGDYKEFNIKILNTDSNTNVQNSDSEVTFALIPYRNRLGEATLNKTCTASSADTEVFTVALETEDTEDLYGQYIYQFSARVPNNSDGKIVSYQGLLTIDKNINPNSFTN